MIWIGSRPTESDHSFNSRLEFDPAGMVLNLIVSMGSVSIPYPHHMGAENDARIGLVVLGQKLGAGTSC
jgi:hypothetical protein